MIGIATGIGTELPPAELRRAKSRRPGGACPFERFLGSVPEQQRGIRGLLIRPVITKKPVDRHPPDLSQQVPQSHLDARSEEHTSELQSLMRISYAGFDLKKKTKNYKHIENE